MINLKQLSRSFSFALRGFLYALKTEQNLKAHLLVSVLVVSMMIFFKVSYLEASVLVLVISFVIILELINTAFEKLSDLLKPRIHQYVKHIKDVMAAMVFIGAFSALIIGVLIFMPYFLRLNIL